MKRWILSLVSSAKVWGFLITVVTLVASITVPEIRSLIGLDDDSENQILNGMAMQNGKFKLLEFGVSEVFYPQPFDSPPNLQFAEGAENPGRFHVLEQRADGFKYEIEYAFSLGSEVEWEATGIVTQ
jgi:hypothetical protein